VESNYHYNLRLWLVMIPWLVWSLGYTDSW